MKPIVYGIEGFSHRIMNNIVFLISSKIIVLSILLIGCGSSDKSSDPNLSEGELQNSDKNEIISENQEKEAKKSSPSNDNSTFSVYLFKSPYFQIPVS